MKCRVCGRQLSEHTMTDIGTVCAKKAMAETNEPKKIKVEPLFIRRQPRRSYLVFTTPRRRVVVKEQGSERSATCECSKDVFCEHIALVAQIDRSRFPEPIAA